MTNTVFKIKRLFLQSDVLLLTFGFSICVLLARSLYIDSPDIVMDDAYISFRYSVNLANGHGLVFNLNERVEGYTNFLWTFLLAGCAYLRLDIVMCSKILSMCASICTLFILYRFTKHLFTSHQRPWEVASLPLIIFSVMPSQARYIVSGMETSLFVFLVTLSVYLFYRCRWFSSGVAFSLATMARPEGLMYFSMTFGYGIIFLREALNKHQEVGKFISQFLGSFALIYVSYFMWRYSYYGYLLPNTFYAKASGFSFARFERGWNYLEQVIGSWSIVPLLLIGLVALLSIRSNRVWLLFAGFPVVTAAYFIYVGGDFIVWFGPRFLMPTLPFILLMTAEGFFCMSSFIRPLHASLFLTRLLSLLLLINSLWFSWPSRFNQLNDFKAQMRSWRELGIWMKFNLPSNTKIATDAAGLIPFYSNLYTIDMFGLTDKYIAHLDTPTGVGIVAHEKSDPFYILRRKPDCIVSTWMNDKGQAISAGLGDFTKDFENLYKLMAVAKVRYGAPANNRWVITTSVYSTEFFNNGYQTGLFCLKVN